MTVIWLPSVAGADRNTLADSWGVMLRGVHTTRRKNQLVGTRRFSSSVQSRTTTICGAAA